MSAKDLVSELQVAVSDTQGKKLMRGGSIQLSPHQVGVGPVSIKMDAKKVKKILRATQKGKGVRVSLSPQEVEMNGEGLWDLIKKGAKWLKDNNLIRPLLKAGAKTVLPLAAGVFGGPAASAAVSSVADQYADSAVDKAGDVLGFGVRGARGKARKTQSGGALKRAPKTPREPKRQVATALDNNSNFIIPSAPASHPPAPSVPDQSMARYETGAMMRGGSFKLAGSSFKLAGSSFK